MSKRTRRRSADRTARGLLAGCLLGLAAPTLARPNPGPRASDGGSPESVVTAAAAAEAHSCDAVWALLSAPESPWSAEVSLRQNYQLAGVSSLSPVESDGHDRFSVRAHLFDEGEQAPGVIEVRFGRGGPHSGGGYDLRVETCDAREGCRTEVVQGTRLQCSTRRGHATLTARDVGRHQRVVVSFSR